jgi:hypothetical protein
LGGYIHRPFLNATFGALQLAANLRLLGVILIEHRLPPGSHLKHSFEKIGDHWEPKTRRGPSDDQDAKTGSEARRSSTPTVGGVDAYATKAHLMDVARRLDVKGRSRMTKVELVTAIERANHSATSRARRTAS